MKKTYYLIFLIGLLLIGYGLYSELSYQDTTAETEDDSNEYIDMIVMRASLPADRMRSILPLERSVVFVNQSQYYYID